MPKHCANQVRRLSGGSSAREQSFGFLPNIAQPVCGLLCVVRSRKELLDFVQEVLVVRAGLLYERYPVSFGTFECSMIQSFDLTQPLLRHLIPRYCRDTETQRKRRKYKISMGRFPYVSVFSYALQSS
jgi:hypothetical protein